MNTVQSLRWVWLIPPKGTKAARALSARVNCAGYSRAMVVAFRGLGTSATAAVGGALQFNVRHAASTQTVANSTAFSPVVGASAVTHSAATMAWNVDLTGCGPYVCAKTSQVTSGCHGIALLLSRGPKIPTDPTGFTSTAGVAASPTPVPTAP